MCWGHKTEMEVPVSSEQSNRDRMGLELAVAH